MITHSDFHDWLLKVGMGWIGWTEQQTLDTHMAAIVLAYEGRADMLGYIFGGKAEEPGQVEPAEPISQDGILSILRAMNAHPERARSD